MNKKQNEAICKWLDERYDIAIRTQKELDKNNIKQNNADWTYYRGMLDMLFACGYEWERDEKGKHIFYKR